MDTRILCKSVCTVPILSMAISVSVSVSVNVKGEPPRSGNHEMVSLLECVVRQPKSRLTHVLHGTERTTLLLEYFLVSFKISRTK